MICSPLSSYFALASLVLGTAGQARKQILDAMSAKDISQVTEGCSLITESISPVYEDEKVKRILGNSSRLSIVNGLWSNTANGYEFREEYIASLEGIADIDCFDVDFDNRARVSKEISDWAKQRTNGFLSPDIEISPLDNLVLANLLYFNARWSDDFSERDTEDDIFHAPSKDVNVAFMHDKVEGRVCIKDDFIASERYLGGAHDMVFFLPNEGISPRELFDTSDRAATLLATDCTQRAFVEWSLPKFDVSSTVNLVDFLKGLGVCDVFEFSDAFMKMLTGPSADRTRLSNIEQRTRLSIDEKGCEAASLSTCAWACFGCSPELDTVAFTVNRPFAFIIFERLWGGFGEQREKRVPLLFGIVEDPSE